MAALLSYMTAELSAQAAKPSTHTATSSALTNLSATDGLLHATVAKMPVTALEFSCTTVFGKSVRMETDLVPYKLCLEGIENPVLSPA